MKVVAPKGLTASRLRLLLSAAIALIVLGGIGIFYLTYAQLSKIAAETGEKAASAKQSQSTVSRLKALQTDLESKKDLIDLTSLITADSQNYAYQDRLVNDLTIYASRANLKIKTISFTSQTSSTPAPAAAAAPDTTGAGEAAATTEAAAPATQSAALNKATVDITLESPVNYRDLLNFLHYIEQNLTKLKVSKVSMTKSDVDNVTIDVLNLEVYIK